MGSDSGEGVLCREKVQEVREQLLDGKMAYFMWGGAGHFERDILYQIPKLLMPTCIHTYQ